MNILRILYLAAACAAVSLAGAGVLPFSLTGTGDIGLENVALSENDGLDADTTLIHGLKMPARLVLMGHASGYDLNLITNFYINGWNDGGIHFDLFTLEAKNRRLRLTLGDSYLRQRSSTVLHRRLRGVKAAYTAYLLDWNLAAGISNLAQDLDSRIAHPDYRRTAAAGTFRQYLAWGSVTIRPLRDLSADLTVLTARDDKGSLSRDTSQAAITNTVAGGHIRYALLDRKIVIDADYNRSGYKEDRGADTAGTADNAFTLDADARLNMIRLRAGFKLIGADYYTAGYPYLDTDRMGFSAGAGYTVKGFVRTAVDYETYTGNLGDDSLLYDTRTDILEADVTTAWNKAPNVGLSYSLKKQKSPPHEDNTLVDRVYHHVGGKATISRARFRGSLGASYRMLDENSQLYIALDDSGTAGTEDTTIFDASGQLSLSGTIRYRISRGISVNAGINNVFISNTTRDGTAQNITANYYYAGGTASLAGGRYRPSLNLLLTTYRAETVPGQDYLQVRTDLSLEYRLNRTQSAAAKYGLEYRTAADSAGDMQNDYTANTVGIEYKISF